MKLGVNIGENLKILGSNYESGKLEKILQSGFAFAKFCVKADVAVFSFGP